MKKIIGLSIPFFAACLMLGMFFFLIGNSYRVLADNKIKSTFTVCPDGPPTCDYSIIQDAIDGASDGDTIQVAEGVYTDINNYVGLAQIVYLNKSITIQGGYTVPFTDPPDPQTNPTILDAQGQGRVFYIDNSAPTLDGLIITGGDSTGLSGTPYGDDAGGGMYIINSQLLLQNSIITGNISPWDGGGIYNIYSQPTILGSMVSNNQAVYGAGIYIWYSIHYIANTTIISNTGVGAGGVWMGVYSAGTFEHNLFAGNVATAESNEVGAGLVAERSEVTLNGNTFHRNTTQAGGSGAVLIRCNATLTNNIFSNNLVETSGGALLLNGTDAQLIHNTFTTSQGPQNNGIYLATHWEPRVSNATILNTILVSNTTGIFAESGNTASLDATLWGSDEWANGIDWAGSGDIVTGTINLWVDPAFVDPQSGDYHITFSSPAIDAGIDAGVTTDIDGQPRPNGMGPDIGADEYYGVNLIVTTLEDELNTDGDCSLREAISAANTNTSVDACPAGDAVITDTITFDVVGIITVTSQLSVTAGGPLVIDGGNVITTSGGGTTRVFMIYTGSNLMISNLTIDDGFSDKGGGIYNDGRLKLINITLSNNNGGAEGGGLDNWGNAEIISSTINNNYAENEWLFISGGGIANRGSINITNSKFSGNDAYAGGAMSNVGAMVVTNSVLSGNSAENGGGISSNNGTIVLSNSILSGNNGWWGGGIFNQGTMMVTNCTLSGNSSDSSGGAIHEYGGTLTITNSTLFGNSAEFGGSLYKYEYGSTITAINTIIANSPSGGDCYGTITDGGHNISSDDTCGFDPANGSMPNTDPLLSPLQDNGGPTWTHALLPSSPAIDAGDDAQCPPSDQRGVPRPQDGDGDNLAICDIGSFELEGPYGSPTLVTITGFGEGFVGNTYTFTATVEPVSTTLPLEYVWQTTEQPTITHTGGLSDTIDFIWEVPGTKVINVTASNPGGSVVDTHIITITGQITIKPESVIITGTDEGSLGNTYLFTATIEPISTTLPLDYIWLASGQIPVYHTSGLTDTVSYQWNIPGTRTITVIASNLDGSVSDSHTIKIIVPNGVFLPLVIKSAGAPLGASHTSSSPEAGAIFGLVMVGMVGKWKRRG